MKNVGGLLIKAAITMILVACGGQSSDPLKEYGNLKLVPKNEDAVEVQSVEVPMFKILVSGTAEKAYGNFVVNKKGNVEVKVVQIGAKNQIENAQLEVLDFNGETQPAVTKTSANTFVLTWMPKSNSLERIDFKVAVKAKVEGKLTEQTKDLVFTVTRNVKSPQIKTISGLSNKEFQEGQTYKFSILVNDPNYEGQGKPQMIFPEVRYENDEAYMADASKLKDEDFSIRNNPENKGSGNFLFHYILDLRKLPDAYNRKREINTDASKVTMCLNIGVLSVGPAVSGIAQECVEAKYIAQPAKVELLSENRKVKAGESNSIDLKITNSKPQAKVDVLKPESQIANLSGTKTINCTGLNENSATCTITWTPSCKARDNTQKSSLLKITAKSILNDTAKDSNLSEQFEIDASSCEAAAKTEQAGTQS